MAGDTLQHCNLTPDHLLINGGLIYVTGWSRAARAADWADLALLAPLLVAEGHHPEEAEQLLAELPVWNRAPRQGVAGLAALSALAHMHDARSALNGKRQLYACRVKGGLLWLEHLVDRYLPGTCGGC
ncbi:MAG TPA: hypothetical protein VFV66_17045 [Nonomuraea sp.]|nr:hypothetical protein [Nonomuraea sp.]